MNEYTSFDFMKIFNIKKGSWNKLKNKLDLDRYGEQISENKKTKILYTEDAFNILKEHFNNKKADEVQNEIKDNPQMLLLIQQNNILSKTVEEYRNSKEEFRILFESEREKNNSYVITNKELELKNIQLENEINNLKNRNLIKRIFNIY